MNIEGWQGCDEADKYSDSVNANSRFIYYSSTNEYKYKFTDQDRQRVALAWLHLEQLRTSCARDHWKWSGYLQFATQLASNCYGKTAFFEIYAFDRKAYNLLDSLIISNSPKTVDIQTSSNLNSNFVTSLQVWTCKNRLRYNLYCVGGDMKHCSLTHLSHP